MHRKSLLSLLATTSQTFYALTLPTMKAEIWNLVDILMNHDPRQGQLIPESMMPFNLSGERLPAEPPPPPPRDEPLSDSPCISATYLPFNYFNK